MPIKLEPAPTPSQCAACNAVNWEPRVRPTVPIRPVYRLEITTPPGNWRSETRLCTACLADLSREIGLTLGGGS